MAAVIFHEPVFSTQVASGDKLFFYEVGTTTDLTVYTDYALTTAASQPVVADADGRFSPIYFDATGNDPKVVLKDSTDVEKWTCDRYPVDDLTTLTASVATNTSDIAVLEGRMATAEADIDVLETESADYEARLTTLEGVTSNVVDSDFTGANQSLSVNGYQIFPGGMIIQWGTTTGIPSGGTKTVTFPLEFPTTCQAVAPAITSGDFTWTSIQIDTIGATSFRFDNAQSAYDRSATWIAVGY